MRYAAQGHTYDQVKQENQYLLQKLQKLEREHNHLKAEYGTVTQQLSQLYKKRGEMDAMSGAALTAKTNAAMDLKSTLDKRTEELEHQEIQVGFITVSR